MKYNIRDLVTLRGRPDPLGFITKLKGSTAFVLWWPTSKKPQHKTFCDVERLIVMQSSQVKRGRPRKKK
jgi:hypothetical protein